MLSPELKAWAVERYAEALHSAEDQYSIVATFMELFCFIPPVLDPGSAPPCVHRDARLARVLSLIHARPLWSRTVFLQTWLMNIIAMLDRKEAATPNAGYSLRRSAWLHVAEDDAKMRVLPDVTSTRRVYKFPEGDESFHFSIPTLNGPYPDPVPPGECAVHWWRFVAGARFLACASKTRQWDGHARLSLIPWLNSKESFHVLSLATSSGMFILTSVDHTHEP